MKELHALSFRSSCKRFHNNLLLAQLNLNVVLFAYSKRIMYLCTQKIVNNNSISMHKFFTLILLLLPFTAFAQHGEYVGGDISLLPSYEASNTVYLDGQGNKIPDLITWLTDECKWNTFRVRLFVNPSDTKHEGVVQDLEYVKALGKRIKDAGAKFLLDFHYSDTWVDATHIQAPAECNGMTADQKADWIYTYTKSSLEALTAAGAKPDFVQVGNEIMYGFMGIKVAPYDKSDSDWTGYLKVLSQGCKAVRDVCPNAQIIIHTDRACNISYNNYYYGKLDAAGIAYDIIGISYYPFWHGWLTKAQSSSANTNLEAALNDLATSFPKKKVQIVECAYPIQWWPSSGISYDTRPVWPVAEGKCDGQYKFIKDLIAELANHPNVNGLSYWFPEEAGNGDAANWTTMDGVVINSWLNRGLWWPTSSNGHWPLSTTEGMAHYLFKDFLDPTIAGINEVTSPSPVADSWFTISGTRISAPNRPGIYIHNGRKMVVK